MAGTTESKRARQRKREIDRASVNLKRLKNFGVVCGSIAIEWRCYVATTTTIAIDADATMFIPYEIEKICAHVCTHFFRRKKNEHRKIDSVVLNFSICFFLLSF